MKISLLPLNPATTFSSSFSYHPSSSIPFRNPFRCFNFFLISHWFSLQLGSLSFSISPAFLGLFLFVQIKQRTLITIKEECWCFCLDISKLSFHYLWSYFSSLEMKKRKMRTLWEMWRFFVRKGKVRFIIVVIRGIHSVEIGKQDQNWDDKLSKISQTRIFIWIYE